MRRIPLDTYVLLTVVLAAAGCASTRVINTWQEPKFSGPKVTSVMVIDVTAEAGIRRTFEDEFVRQLNAKGVRAVASYTLIPDNGEVPKDQLADAVKRADVQGVIVTRVVKVMDVPAVVYSGPYYYPGGPYPYAGGPGFYGYYSWAWAGYYAAPQAYTYQTVISETNLFDAQTETLIWSGTTQNYPSTNVKAGISEFITVVVKALSASELI
jgi:hypothetical protein